MSLETYGRYQLIKKLATGGMAQIYLARQLGVQGFEKLLVVKRILPHLAENEDFITMFLDEARIAARLNHPNVVQIFDLGQQDDTFYIAMEYIHGEDVRKVWKQAERQGTQIPLPLICRIIIEACAGLDYAHKKADPGGRPLNIVHRDISPQNILVSFEGGVKVVDFGIAKAADQATVTKSGVLKGKYSYMSPEQAQGKPVDARTDVFALGVVLYELLTGTRLFKRANDIQTLNAVTECKVEPPSAIDERLPKELDAIVMRALAKDRGDRYADARELQEALEAWLLKNKLPSGSVHLAAFMQDIYAERLAREAEEGRLLFTESGQDGSYGDGPEKATPNVARPTKSIRSQASRQSVPRVPSRDQLTRAEAGRSASNPRPVELGADVKVQPTENSLPTQQGGGRKGPLIALGVVVGLAAVLAAVAVLRPSRAHVVVTSDPPGATVRFGGRAIDCRTPCTLPAVAGGEYPLELAKKGFRPLKTSLVIPAGGEQTSPFSLEPDPTEGAGPAVAAPLVAVTLTSEPAGATVTIDGEKQAGRTPLTVQRPAGTTASLIVELDGHQGQSLQLEVPAGQTTLERAFVLKPDVPTKPTAATKPPGAVKPPVVQPAVKPPEVRATGSGTVRFVATPYATVECPPYRFGDTPFGDKQMAAGEYRCTFTNAELGKSQTKTIRVEANDVLKVKVSFE
ncbi:MAG: protein kinase [Myxococcaceae bacterium]|nr:protein kinase [Myxococcaceae bacterium]